MTDHRRVRAAVDKLREDAGTWRGTAAGARRIADVAAELSLTGVELSFAADEAGLTTTYQQLRQRLADLCGQATGTLDGIARTLTEAADGFDALEQDNRNNITQAGPR